MGAVLGHLGGDLGQVDDLSGGVARRGVLTQLRVASLAAGGPVVDDGVGVGRHLQDRAFGPSLLALVRAGPALRLARSSTWRWRSAAGSRDGGLPEFPECCPAWRSSSATRVWRRSFISRSAAMVPAWDATIASGSAGGPGGRSRGRSGHSHTGFRAHPARLLLGGRRNLQRHCARTSGRQTWRVGKRSRRRRSMPAAHPDAELVDAVLGLLPQVADDIAGPPVPGPVDIEPLLVAVLAGVLDDHLSASPRFSTPVSTLFAWAPKLLADTRFHVGDRVRLGHNLRPLYLHGRSGTIESRRGDTWVVQLDEPVGRFTTGEIRVRSTQLELGT